MALDMSILDAVLKRRITPAQGLALAETWAGQELKQVPAASSSPACSTTSPPPAPMPRKPRSWP